MSLNVSHAVVASSGRVCSIGVLAVRYVVGVIGLILLVTAAT